MGFRVLFLPTLFGRDQSNCKVCRFSISDTSLGSPMREVTECPVSSPLDCVFIWHWKCEVTQTIIYMYFWMEGIAGGEKLKFAYLCERGHFPKWIGSLSKESGKPFANPWVVKKQFSLSLLLLLSAGGCTQSQWSLLLSKPALGHGICKGRWLWGEPSRCRLWASGKEETQVEPSPEGVIWVWWRKDCAQP